MKKIIAEVEGAGLISLLGQRVTFYCMNYFYTGDLTGVNEVCVELSNPSIIYETGPHNTKEWKNAQALPNTLYVMMSAIESFGVMK